jgi:hypothetical protein
MASAIGPVEIDYGQLAGNNGEHSVGKAGE